jgi:hypothetical protein
VIVLAHDRRRVVHFEVAKNPMQVWLARQIQSAFPWDAAPRYLLRDRDASYGQAFRDHVEAMGIKEVATFDRRRQEGCSTLNSSTRYCALRPAPPVTQIQASCGLSESCPKIGDVPKSPFPSVAALVPSAGTIHSKKSCTLQKELRSARVPCEHPPVLCPACCFPARGPLIERQKPCKYLQSCKENR